MEKKNEFEFLAHDALNSILEKLAIYQTSKGQLGEILILVNSIFQILMLLVRYLLDVNLKIVTSTALSSTSPN